ncbi:resolvase [Pseudomonas aeruginosa]|nr:resolvase [Pseudomonas aeruginosa]
MTAANLCNRAHTSIEHSRDWCRSLLILNCQELAAQQPLRPINWCSRLLKMTPGLGRPVWMSA